MITLTALKDMMEEGEVRKALVIAPLRVARDTWPGEIRKWDHLREVKASVIVGDVKNRMKALGEDAQICIINRENIKWLVETYGVNHRRWDFDCVVIDELSSFKSSHSQRFKWLQKVRPWVRRWIGLTGTPTANGLMDLWAEISILDGGKRLGRSIYRYRDLFFRPGAMNPYTGAVYEYFPRPGAEEEIYRRISDMTVSMKALDYLKMPECLSVVHTVEMSQREVAVYEKMRRELRIQLEGGDVTAANGAALCGKLLQMSNGAVYDEEGRAQKIHDRKLEMLGDLMEAANGQPVLIAYWFRHDRDRIREYLEEMGWGCREIRGTEDLEDWNAGRISVGLIHPVSAGHGLNMQEGGHILVWFGLTWSLEMYLQTNGRLWRQGQERTVTIHHIVTKGTMDEDVMRALEGKNVTRERLIAAVKARLG